MVQNLCPLPQGIRRKKTKIAKHNRALKQVTAQKKTTKNELKKAKREGQPTSILASLTIKLLSFIRKHSHLKKTSNKLQAKSQSWKAHQSCYKHVWRFTSDLLDNDPCKDVSPSFNSETATSFFSKIYVSHPTTFHKPLWMPTPKPPTYNFPNDPISDEELHEVIRRVSSISAPSPFDQIPYSVFKKCPSIRVALLDVFNSCLSTKSILSQWKNGSVKLIAKQSALSEPSSPGNFRPIALASTISKLFTSIFKNRLQAYMTENGSLDSNIQKAFLPATPGCIEHYAKLASVISSSIKSHRSIAIAWLDLANVYESVHHDLILHHYHLPHDFCHLVELLYTDLSATITTNQWSSSQIPIKKRCLPRGPPICYYFQPGYQYIS